uniref:Uncharacterized protein n=1 Tax=Picea sitchensis TaxID=3332 RepID=D5AAZ9_PICSI|nr:unknown [Picea sitchensis]
MYIHPPGFDRGCFLGQRTPSQLLRFLVATCEPVPGCSTRRWSSVSLCHSDPRISATRHCFRWT